ncbi:MAG: hypothetical protein HQK52_08095 [Oligoflexia bacterium]|nr:hypothetical protein [Oligoflexia bacterium]
MNYPKQLAVILFLLICYHQIIGSNSAFADLAKPIPQELMDAQTKCDPAVFNKYPWASTIDPKNQLPIHQLAKDRVIIVNNVRLKNLPLDSKLEQEGYYNLYELTYRYFDDFSCDRSEENLKKFYSNSKLAREDIEDRFEEDDFYMQATKDNKFLIELAVDQVYNSIYPNFMKKNINLDRNKSGFICMIQFEDFIKDQNVINIDRLCEGQSQSKKDLLKWALGNLHAFYKTKYPEWKKTAKPDRK